MNGTLSSPTFSGSVLRPDTDTGTAKPAIRKPDKELTKRELGECLGYVRYACNLGLEEFAHALGIDPRYLKRMIDGVDRPQIELLWANDEFRKHLIIAMAKRCTDGVDVTVTISIKGES